MKRNQQELSRFRGLARVLGTLGFVAALAVAAPARAGLLVSLNTGQGLSNLQSDPNWQVTSSYFGGATIGTKVLDAPGFPFNGPWVVNTADSKWITPDNAAFTQDNAPPASAPDLTFTYSTTFDLTASQAALAYIAADESLGAGRWSSDNNGLAIYLNGVLIDGTNTGDNAYNSWHSFAPITSGFVAGTNILEFVVKNIAQGSGNPTGFRMEAGVFTQPVPEPSALALSATGLGLLGLANWRRKRKTGASA